MDSISGAGFQVSIDHCIFRVKDLLKQGNFPNFITDYTTNCLNGISSAKLFKDISKDNFHLDTLSAAENKAKYVTSIQFDLDQKLRDPQSPDIGCYEYQK
ncbi:MAG: hypothetical protein IPH96_14130 [Saprospiraceae bacterium]|nr:hypothetical protein [Saprospiraceae bacterium]